MDDQYSILFIFAIIEEKKDIFFFTNSICFFYWLKVLITCEWQVVSFGIPSMKIIKTLLITIITLLTVLNCKGKKDDKCATDHKASKKDKKSCCSSDKKKAHCDADKKEDEKKTETK